MKVMIRNLFLLMTLLVFTASCDDQQTAAERDLETILRYIEDNNLDAEEHPTGLYYIIDEPGTGDNFPSANARVEVKYKGYFTDGRVFDESPGENTVEFSLGQVITGWRIGIPLLKKGGKGTFIVPSALGYGFFGSGPVPPSTVIIFDVELVNFSG